MFRKTLIALAATAALATGMAATAEAKTNIIIGIGGGYGYGGGYGGGYGCCYGGIYGGGYHDDYGYDSDCQWYWVKYKKWNNSHTHFIIKKKKVLRCY